MAITGSGTATNRTHIDMPADVSAEIIQKTQEQSAVMQMARAADGKRHTVVIL